jgi:short-subunit dehydrogenase
MEWLVQHSYLMGLIFSVTLLSWLTYTWRILSSLFYRVQNLHTRYISSPESPIFAIVTGASSGIGLAICRKLASQGIHVIMVALDDALLKEARNALQTEFPEIQWIPCGVNLADTSGAYMDRIEAVSQGLELRLLFNNAGYITTGLFSDTSLASQLQNMECNVTAAVRLTHFFLNRVLTEQTIPLSKRRGLITFTSSSAAYLPNPMATIYGSTKAFLTEFAASLAPEVYSQGIDVVVVHPSPTHSRFYDNVGHLAALKLFQKTAVSPAIIADVLFASVGRCVIRDQGYFSIITSMWFKVVDWGFFVNLVPHIIHFNATYQSLIKMHHRHRSKSL